MSDVEPDLKPVHKLLVDASGKPIRYRIAAYQRGYRWTPQQVTQLLEDIYEFTQRENPQPEDFYCLQPLVMKQREDGAFEVVDGQQRLTTLLLSGTFNARMTEEFRDALFTLEYETRRELLSFLKNPSDERAASNIDFFHIARAIKRSNRGSMNDEPSRRRHEVRLSQQDESHLVRAFARRQRGRGLHPPERRQDTADKRRTHPRPVSPAR